MSSNDNLPLPDLLGLRDGKITELYELESRIEDLPRKLDELKAEIDELEALAASRLFDTGFYQSILDRKDDSGT